MATEELVPDILAIVAARLKEQKARRLIDLEELVRATKFSKQELRKMYRGFKQECPNGEVSEDTFKEIFEKFFPYGNVSSYAHHVFKAFDLASCGSITFRDFIISLSTLLHGTETEKLNWTFRMYDLNGDGMITKTELANVLVAVCELMGIDMRQPIGSTLGLDYLPKKMESVSVDMNALSWLGLKTLPDMTSRQLKDTVDSAFNRLDWNQDGILTRDEFVEGCIQNAGIASSLGNLQFQL